MDRGIGTLKWAVIVMGVLILLGTTAMIIVLFKRASGTAPAATARALAPGMAFRTMLDEPEGTALVSVTASSDRLVVHLRGAGSDRLVVIDPVSGAILGRIVPGR